MSLIDNPDKWIIKMFKFNERETGGNGAGYYPNGQKSDVVDLRSDELIYGHFTSNEKKYYFTSSSLIITNGQQDRILINEVINTNGSFRSGHKTIDVVTIDQKKRRIKIEEFPYRIQQLFYQLIERHGSLNKKSLFDVPNRLKSFCTNISQNDLNKFKFHNDPKTVIKLIDIKKTNKLLEYHGKILEDFIYPDDNGVLILRIKDNERVIDLFNSTTDGYNGVIESAVKKDNKILLNFNLLENSVDRLIIKLNYSIEDFEFSELKTELNLESQNDINNLFSSIEVYSEKDEQLKLLTEFETQ